MPIKYFLCEAHLANIDGAFLPRIQMEPTLGIEQLARDVATGLSVSEIEVQAILNATFGAIEASLVRGRPVDLAGIAKLSLSMKGTFSGPEDVFDSARHSIAVTATPGKRLSDRVANSAAIEKTGRPEPVPNLLGFNDIASGGRTGDITAGGIGQINGSFLSFDDSCPDQGVYITDVNGELAQIKITLFQKHTDREIVFAIPALSGYTDITLVIRKRNSANGNLVTGASETLTVV